MSSLDSVLLRKNLGRGIVRQVTNDASVGMRLRYIGTGTVTTVAATQATSVVLTTSDGGTDTYLFSSYSTLGALVDAINADGIFEAKVMDALRSEDPDDFFLTTASQSASTDGNGNAIYDLLVDTSAAATFSCLLSPSLDFDSPKGHRVSLREIFYNVNNTAAADGISVFKRNPSKRTESELLHRLNVDDTDTTITWASGEGFITLQPDEEFVVQLDGTVVDDSGNQISLVGFYE